MKLAAPWFDAIRGDAAQLFEHNRVAHDVLNGIALARSVTTASGRPLRFVAAGAAGKEPYESFIARTGTVPTRNNAHDLFNALMWLAFPRTKARLNALHARVIAASGGGATRGAARDAATLIDENGVLFVTAHADRIQALRRHDWSSLFVTERAAWNAEIRPLVIGHALLEKLISPYKGITGHALPVHLPASSTLEEVDACAAAVVDEHLTPGDLLPLPVAGIPGWYPGNDDRAFYADTAVFRPARLA